MKIMLISLDTLTVEPSPSPSLSPSSPLEPSRIQNLCDVEDFLLKTVFICYIQTELAPSEDILRIRLETKEIQVGLDTAAL